MWTKEQRAEAFKSYRIETIDGKTYAVVTCDFGRRRGENLLGASSSDPRRWYMSWTCAWHGTTVAADNRFEKRRRRLQELNELRGRQP